MTTLESSKIAQICQVFVLEFFFRDYVNFEVILI